MNTNVKSNHFQLGTCHGLSLWHPKQICVCLRPLLSLYWLYMQLRQQLASLYTFRVVPTAITELQLHIVSIHLAPRVTGLYQVKCPTENYIFFLLYKLIQRLLFWRLAACYQSCCLKIKGNHFPAESGQWWITNDEMTRMSDNWMFDAGSNWMRGRVQWKANTLWSALFHDMLYSLVDVRQWINERWKTQYFPLSTSKNLCNKN